MGRYPTNRPRKEQYTPEDIEGMSLTEIADHVRRGSEISNLISFYNASRKDGEPRVCLYKDSTLMHPSHGYNFTIHFEKRGENENDNPAVVRFNSITEVRSFIIGLMALRKVRGES